MFCQACKIDVESAVWLFHLRTNLHKRNAAETINQNLKRVKSCFSNRIETLIFENKDESLLDVGEFLKRMEDPLMEYLRKTLAERLGMKINIELFAEFVKMDADMDSECVVSIKSFHTKMQAIINCSELEIAFNNMATQIKEKMEEFQEKDSGWALMRITHCELNVNEFKPLRGTNFIPLPKYLTSKRACVNVKNKDIYCFKWSVISAMNPVDIHSDRTSSYQIDNIADSVIRLNNGMLLNFCDLKFPMKIKDIAGFEQLNQSVSVNLFGYDDEIKKIVGPYYLTKQEKTHHINLLLLQAGEKYHYVWIKNISSMLYPDFIVGFDLVGQEDLGQPLYSFLPQLKKMPKGAQLFLHAGETNWQGSTDLNLLDAILLNATRIGHGFALAKHPVLLHAVKNKGIAIEINPISNQVLHLLWDMRNHPAAFFLSENIPAVISNDDPGFWNAKGLSYDFYYTFMSLIPATGGLKVLKQLVWNSIIYSMMSPLERSAGLTILQRTWDEFLEKILSRTK